MIKDRFHDNIILHFKEGTEGTEGTTVHVTLIMIDKASGVALANASLAIGRDDQDNAVVRA